MPKTNYYKRGKRYYRSLDITPCQIDYMDGESQDIQESHVITQIGAREYYTHKIVTWFNNHD